ncbi:MAG: DUF4340 domain-containing protein [SAR324 cluster bacterium]|nr:DUF4340 domain-containing protein [SAR324 cluster bacterium]
MLQKLSIVAGILVMLSVVLWFVGTDSSSTVGQPKQNVTILSELDTQKLFRIDIQGSKDKVGLVKGTDLRWKVEGMNYDADSKKIQELLVQLLKVKLGDKVTEKVEHHARFQLIHLKDNNNQWEEQKTGKLLHLKGPEGTTLLEILLGKNRSEKSGSQQGQYIRYADKPAVYLIAENIDLDVTGEDWLDTEIMDLKGSDLFKTIELQRTTEIFRFMRKTAQDEWSAEGLKKEKLNQTAIQSMSNALENLTFDNIVPMNTPVEKTGRQELTYYVVELFDGRIVRLSVGEREAGEEKNYYVAVEMDLGKDVNDETLKGEVQEFNQRSKPWLYSVSSWVGQRFLKQRSDLITDDKEAE